MFASVIPAVKMPRGLREFDYEIPEALLDKAKRGCLVEVPWRRHLVVGLITAVHTEPSAPNLRIKPLAKLIVSQPLPDDFVAMFEWLPDWTFSSPTACLRAFLPSFTKKLLVNGLPTPAQFNPSNREPSPRVICYRSPTEKMNLVTEHVTDALKSGQTLILAPHQSDAQAIGEHLRAETGATVTEVLGATSTKSYREAWLAAMTGEAKIIVGTRSAASFPLPRLATIIVTESDSRDHRQYDQNPRFDAREIAAWRAERSGSDLVVMSHAPRPEDLVNAESKSECRNDVAAEVILANVTRQEKFDAGLSTSALKWIEQALQNGKKVLIFHNRLGEALAIFCRDCGEPLRCQKCCIALRQHGDQLKCHRCRSTRLFPDTCPGCGGVNLKPLGAGSQGLSKLLTKRFPDARIDRLDSESARPKRLEADIIIGTQLAVHELSELSGLSDDLTTVIATDTDELLSHPGFRTTEQAWRTVTTLRHLAGKGQLILETLDPENPRLRRLLEPADKFLSDELKIRTEAKYPPVSDLITITLADSSEETGRRDLEKLRIELTKASGPSVGISRPMAPSQPFRHGKWRWVLAIRHASTSRPLLDMLSRLPEQYLIERDPESIT